MWRLGRVAPRSGRACRRSRGDDQAPGPRPTTLVVARPGPAAVRKSMAPQPTRRRGPESRGSGEVGGEDDGQTVHATSGRSRASPGRCRGPWPAAWPRRPGARGSRRGRRDGAEPVVGADDLPARAADPGGRAAGEAGDRWSCCRPRRRPRPRCTVGRTLRAGERAPRARRRAGAVDQRATVGRLDAAVGGEERDAGQDDRGGRHQGHRRGHREAPLAGGQRSRTLRPRSRADVPSGRAGGRPAAGAADAPAAGRGPGPRDGRSAR